jgi:catechol 2,3-dioxygenase-like lactoylglutathione lyase family enzyme
MVPGSMTAAASGGFTLEFQVTDVDARHERLPAQGVEILEPPTTQPWGRCSVWLRDPDANIVNVRSAARTQGRWRHPTHCPLRPERVRPDRSVDPSAAGPDRSMTHTGSEGADARGLLVASGDAASLLQAVDAPLDGVALLSRPATPARARAPCGTRTRTRTSRTKSECHPPSGRTRLPVPGQPRPPASSKRERLSWISS